MSKTDIMPYLKGGFKKITVNTDTFKETMIDCILGFVCAFSTIFSSYAPFGLAFYVATFANSNQIARLVSIIIGTCLSVGIEMGAKYTVPLFLYTASAMYFNFNRNYVKAGVMSCFLMLANIVFAFLNGFLLYDVVVGITESFICFVSVYVMQSALPLIKKYSARNKISPHQWLCVTAIYAIFILSLSKIPTVYGVNISSVLSIALIMVLCYKGEIGMGAALGVIVGVINGINNYNLSSVIGSYALCGLCASFFKTHGKLGVCLGFILANSVATIFLNASTEILINIFDILFASLIFFALPDSAISFVTSFSTKVSTYEKDIQRERELTDIIVKKRILSAAKSFDDLSKIYEESPQYEYTKSELINMFNDTAEKVCSNCSSRFICWQNDYKKTYSEMFEMLKIADEKGTLTTKNMPESFKNKCSDTESFALAFCGMTEKMSIHKMWRARLFESRKNASNQLACIGKVLKEICSDINICVDTQFEQVIRTELDNIGVHIENVCAVAKENDKFEISVSVSETNEKIKEKIKGVIGDLVKSDVRILDLKENNYKIIPREKYFVEVGICQKNKDKETVCGDSVLSSYSNGLQILAISDGMGSGMSAHKESKSAIRLLKGFFNAGFNTETSLKLINSFLLQNGTENFTTLDILSIDLDEGMLRFTKVCGAQSYIKTGINAEKININSYPCGIMEKIESPSCTRKIKDEAVVVMLSDGVVSGIDDKFIEEELKKCDGENSKYIADAIMKRASEIKNNKIDDDMTVIVAKIQS